MISDVFRYPDQAERAIERLEEITGQDVRPFALDAFGGNPAPDLALSNLERWLRSTSNPWLHMQQIVGLPRLGRLLVYLLGASQPLADSLIQNPELASLVLEPGALATPITREGVLDEGRRLLAASTSNSHSLDRLRYLRQKWNLLIVLSDLTERMPQEAVWRALSDLADALLELARETTWREFQAQQRMEPAECPILVVAFGKLAGHELNYSSDVDLVYVAPDGLDEKTDRSITRYCEMLTRAISDRMGRGSLYRVDLRLRPYGAAGPVVRSMTGYEAYYRLYAEPWEVQALVRSRPVAGPPELSERWDAMRGTTCFKPRLSEIALEQMVSMRDRIEQHAPSDQDLKRGTGGIRDVEFLTQALQLLHGHEDEALQALGTLEAIRALERRGYLEHADAASLISGYTFLRKLEHRTQLVGDQQTHSIPKAPEARESLARLMGCGGWSELSQDLTRHRRSVRALYRSILKLDATQHDARGRVQEELGPHAPAALQWFDVLPESEAFYDALLQNESSLDRVRKVLLEAPRLVAVLKESLALTELLLSGEVEEPQDLAARIAGLPVDTPPRVVAKTYSHATTTAVLQWLFGAQQELPLVLTSLADELVRHLCRRLLTTFDVVALGSLGMRELGPSSDLDLLLLVKEPKMHREAELQAQNLLSLVNELRRLGCPVQVDLRLRPEGGKGLLVRTYEGFKNYDFDGMEMWERFALGHARLIEGDPEALERVRYSAYGLPLTPERLKELKRMKRRIETERVKPQHVRRNVKLGYGGISDIEWLVHLHEMRYPTALRVQDGDTMPDRIRRLGRAGFINTLEVQVLLEARLHLLDLRTRLFLMGQSEDLVPENPDKLDRLAHILGFVDGNAFLARHEEVLEAVRRLYTDSLERLRA